jgi:protein TonB
MPPAPDSVTYHIRVIPGDTTVDRNMPKVTPDGFIAVDSQPVPIKQVQATYPRLGGKRISPEGTVWLKCFIRENGTVGDVSVLRSTAEILNDTAIRCVRQWLFRPAMLHGKPVGVWAAIPIRVRPE